MKLILALGILLAQVIPIASAAPKKRLSWACYYNSSNKKIATAKQCETYSKDLFVKYNCQATNIKCISDRTGSAFDCKAKSDRCVFAKLVGKDLVPQCPNGFEHVVLDPSTTAHFCYKNDSTNTYYAPDEKSDSSAQPAK